jgi:hypothetical protein
MNIKKLLPLCTAIGGLLACNIGLAQGLSAHDIKSPPMINSKAAPNHDDRKPCGQMVDLKINNDSDYIIHVNRIFRLNPSHAIIILPKQVNPHQHADLHVRKFTEVTIKSGMYGTKPEGFKVIPHCADHKRFNNDSRIHLTNNSTDTNHNPSCEVSE